MLKEYISKKSIIQASIVLVFMIMLLIIGKNLSSKNITENGVQSFKYNFKNELIKAEVDETHINYSIYDDNQNILVFKQNVGESYISVISTETPLDEKDCQLMLMNYKSSLDEKYKTNILYNETIENVSYLNFTLVDSNKNIINVYTKAESNDSNTLMSTLFLIYEKDSIENTSLQRTYDSITFK